jgi:hypothetical protein
LRPISILFLFDRLLPHYQIISANYDIDQYYKRIPTSQVAAKKAAANEAAAINQSISKCTFRRHI